MGLGGLATIALRKPANLTIVVLDNEHFGETGMQMSHAGQGIDFARSPPPAASPRRNRDLKASTSCASEFYAEPGRASRHQDQGRQSARSLPPRDAVYIKNRFRAHLGFAPI